MNFQDYMQLEVNSTVTENKINLRNSVNLEDDYEVEVLDIIYNHYPNSFIWCVEYKNHGISPLHTS